MATDAFGIIQQFLTRYNLNGLSDWMWNHLVDDTPIDQVWLELRDHPVYLNRFPGMKLREKMGLRAVSEEEYLQNEEAYRRVLNRNGIASTRFDQASDFADLFGKDVSPDELDERAQVWRLVRENPTTSARVKSLFLARTGLQNLTDDDVTRALLGFDNRVIERTALGESNATGLDVSVEAIKDAIREAIAQEEANFASTPSIREDRGVATGLLSADEETF